MSKHGIFFIFSFIIYFCKGQDISHCLNSNIDSTFDQIVKSQSFCSVSNSFANYYLDKTNNYSQSPIYTIKLKFHILQFSETDPRNYTTADIPQMLASVNGVNDLYSNIQPPTVDILQNPSLEETDTRIRFSLDENDIEFVVAPDYYIGLKDNVYTVNLPMYQIIDSKTIKISGNHSYLLNTGTKYIIIKNSNSNNGGYRFNSDPLYSNYNATQNITTIKLLDDIPNISDLTGLIDYSTFNYQTSQYYLAYNSNDLPCIHVYFQKLGTQYYNVSFGIAATNNISLVSPQGMLPPISSKLLAHELGHALGLPHTWTTGNSINDILKPDGTNGEMCNSTNVSNNIMGYNLCQNYLSPLQIAEMRMQINSTSNLSTRVIETHESNNNNVIITGSNVIWDQREIIGGNLTIETGSTLTIKCRVHFSPQGKVIIKPGGKLIVDGGQLTNILGQMWQGVEVWGTTSQNQYPLSQPTYQGKLELINGGTIENAYEGARNWKPNDYTKIGGVIISNGGVFRNNKRSIEFVQYENFSPLNPSIKTNNFSSFVNTDFIIDDNYRDNPSNFQQHVSMWSVYGISFSNCHFSNNVTTKTYVADKNRGIYSIDAGYTINAGCSSLVPSGSTCPETDLLKSSFTGFYKAIEATGAATTKTVVVNQAIFDKNVNGLYFTDMDNFSVNRSLITLGNPGYTTSPTSFNGLYTNSSTGYQIEENQFSKYAGTSYTYGVSINNSGTDNNRVYKNKFTQLMYGLYLVGVNRNPTDQLKGFQFLCNEFNNNSSRAVNIILNNSTNGIRLYQGEYSPLKSAGNTFINTPVGAYTINNGTPNGTIYYHNNGTTLPTYNTANVSLTSTTNANTCPSSFGSSSALMRQSLLNQSDSLFQVYTSLNYNFLSLIDNGNTSAFIENIKNEWSDDAWKLRNELMERSPYVSEKSLIEAIKQNVLPNAMILEVALANPDVTKNEKFVEKLNEIHPLPEYMNEYIRQNDEKTTRTMLEAQMSSISFEKSTIDDGLLRISLTEDNHTFEDLNALFSSRSGAQQKIDLIELAIEKENWSMADSVLNEAINNEDLKEELFLFDNYKEYIDFRSNLYDKKISQLDQEQIDFLTNLAQQKGRVSGYARNILCYFYDLCFEENNEDQKSKSTATNNTELGKPLNEIFYCVDVYPNPSENFTSLKWEILDNLVNCQYIIYDLNGVEINRSDISKNKGELIIDTRNFKSGIYIISIENNGVKMQEKKLIVKN